MEHMYCMLVWVGGGGKKRFVSEREREILVCVCAHVWKNLYVRA